MEYDTSIKRIGGSMYLRLPPKVSQAHKFKDGARVVLRDSRDMVIMETKNKYLDKAARDFLSLRLNLGGKTVTREEIYETDRY